MRIELYGLVFDTPEVMISLRTPWRASHLEHRLFESVRTIPGTEFESVPEELRLFLPDTRAWKQATQSLARVLKGWQEEASDSGTERRGWFWMIEADVNANGYDHLGDPAAVWLFLRLTLDNAGPTEQERGETIDLDNFQIRLAGYHDPRQGP